MKKQIIHRLVEKHNVPIKEANELMDMVDEHIRQVVFKFIQANLGLTVWGCEGHHLDWGFHLLRDAQYKDSKGIAKQKRTVRSIG